MHNKKIITLVCEAEDATPALIKEAYNNFKNQTFSNWVWPIHKDILNFIPELKNDPNILPTNAETIYDLTNELTDYVLFFDLNHKLKPTALEKFILTLHTYKNISIIRGQKSYDYIKFESNKLINDIDYFPLPYLFKSSHLKKILKNNNIEIDIIPYMLRHWVLQISTLGLNNTGYIIPEILETDIHKKNLFKHNYEDENTKEKILTIALEQYPQLNNILNKTNHHIISKPKKDNILNLSLKYDYKNNNKTIAFILKNYNDSNSNKFILNLSNILKQKYQWNIIFISTNNQNNKLREQFDSISDETFSLNYIADTYHFINIIIKILETRNINCTIINGNTLAYQMLPYLKSKYPLKLYIDYVDSQQLHNNTPHNNNMTYLYKEFLNHTITNSLFYKEILIKNNKNINKISLLTPNINTKEWSQHKFNKNEILNRYYIPDTEVYITYLYKNPTNKNIDNLINILKNLEKKEKKKYICIILGDGSNMTYLNDQLDQNDLENIKMIPTTSDEKLKELLALSDIFISPEENTVNQLEIIQAMSMQNAIIATETNINKEILSDKNSILIQNKEKIVLEFTKYIQLLIQNKNTCMTFAENARTSACKKYNIEDSANEFNDIINNINIQPTSNFYPEDIIQILYNEIYNQQNLYFKNQELNQKLDQKNEILKIKQEEIDIMKINSKTPENNSSQNVIEKLKNKILQK